MTEPARATRPTALKRAIVVAAAALLVASSALVSGGPPAHADTFNVISTLALRMTLLDEGGAPIIQLGRSLVDGGSDFIVARDATLDLNGHSLATENIIVSPGVTLAITDDSVAQTGSLSVDAQEGQGAGIQTTDATLIIDGGTITVRSISGAGIGGRNEQIDGSYAPAGGTTIINGGTVDVKSGKFPLEGAAGIGGGAGFVIPGARPGHYGSRGGAGGYTEINGGHVSVDGGFGAGIGGGAGGVSLYHYGFWGGPGGDTRITGGVVVATGHYGAGIGAGKSGFGGADSGLGDDPVSAPGVDGKRFVMTGGYVTASGKGGAGIGGGSSGDSTVSITGAGGAGGTVSVTGGTLIALGEEGAGIGGADSGRYEYSDASQYHGRGGAGATTTIGAAATVVAARTDAKGSAIGPGETGARTDDPPSSHRGLSRGTRVDGTLQLAAGQIFRVASGTALSGSGLITGVDGAGGTIINHGTVTPDVNLDQVDVTVRNFPVTFESNALGGASSSQVVNVFATSMATGARSVPGALSAGAVLTGWNHSADGTGSAFTADTTLSGPLTVYGQWDALAYEMSSNMPDARVGQPVTFSIGAVGGSPAGDLSEQFTFTADSGEPQIAGNVVTFTRPGTWTVTATHDTTGVTVQQQVPVELVLSDPASISLTLSAADAFTGDTVSATVTGIDAYGNALGEITHLAAISSDHATDTVAGADIEVGEHGVRNVSATVGSADAQQPLTVWPHAADYTFSATPAVPYVGDDVALAVTVGGDEVTGDFTFATAAPGAAITGSQVVFEQPGTHVLTATHAVTGVELDRVLNVTVDRTVPAHIELHLSDTTIDEGGSIFFDVTGTDRFGNNVGGLNDLATVTSSHPTDIIDPSGSIHFPTASEHTITAVVGQATASVVVTVIPAAVPVPDEDPAPEEDPDSTPGSGTTPGEGQPAGAVDAESGLPNTGVENSVWVAGAIALLIIGVGATLIIRRKRDSDDHSDI